MNCEYIYFEDKVHQWTTVIAARYSLFCDSGCIVVPVKCKNAKIQIVSKIVWKLNRFSKKYNEEKKHTSLRPTFHLPFGTLILVLTWIDLLPCSCIWPVWPMFYTSQRSYCRYLLICFNQGTSMMTRHNNETDIYTNIVHNLELHFYCIMIIIFQRWIADDFEPGWN